MDIVGQKAAELGKFVSTGYCRSEHLAVTLYKLGLFCWDTHPGHDPKWMLAVHDLVTNYYKNHVDPVYYGRL